MHEILEMLYRDSKLAAISFSPDDTLVGYIEGLSTELVLIHMMKSTAIMSGFVLVEIGAIIDIVWGTHRHERLQRAMSYDAISRRDTPKIDLSSMRAALTGIIAEERVISVVRGRIADYSIVFMDSSIDGDLLVGKCIDRDGEPSGRMACYVEQIIRVDFGGPYERAMQRMAELDKE